MKAQRGAAEVKLFSNSYEVTQMAKFDLLIHIQIILIGTNKILDILSGPL